MPKEVDDLTLPPLLADILGWLNMLNHAQSSSSHKKSTVFLISKHDQSQSLGQKYTTLGWFNPSLEIVAGGIPIFYKLNPLRTPLEQALLWPLVLLRLPAQDTVSGY